MTQARGYAAQTAKAPLAPWTFSRRAVGPQDVAINIRYCGICHSDLHQARDEWGGALFPMVPGHEITGVVTQVGPQVTALKVGDPVGVGCMVNSCRTCPSCLRGDEQYCDGPVSWTYNGLEQDRTTPTYGGYSDHIVVDSRFVLRIPTGMPLDAAAPLLCAGITTYSPLKHWRVGAGHRLGVIGLGGLGHMAVKLGVAMGAHVTVFSRSDAKRADTRRLGAHEYVATDGGVTGLKKSFDFLLDTVSAPHSIEDLLECLKTDGTLILVGVPEKPYAVGAGSLIMQRRRLVGSLIGGIRETQEMLDFCGAQNVVSDIEVIPMQQVNKAYERLLKADVRYRFVLDLSTL
ncbi:MAG: NAD(P)-dependent alcohol dehydrogenase [Nitrospiraceae bacterium]